MGMAQSSKTFRVVISGYYGFRNSGDEAVLRSILLALEDQSKTEGIHIQPVVLSSDPAWTTSMYGVEAVPRMEPRLLWRAIKESHALISGGGSLLQDATGIKSIPYYTGIIKLAQWLGKPTFIYAQGIGPVQRKVMYPLISSVMKKSKYISVRDEQSASFLETIGINKRTIEVVPDPVMGMPLPKETKNVLLSSIGKPKLGISVRFWNKDRSDLSRIGKALVELTKQIDVHLVFLPFHTPDDVEASEWIVSRIRSDINQGSSIEIATLPDDPQIMLQAVSECDALLGMRLHALIYAANQKVPMLGISYDPKIDQFLKRVGSEPVGTTATLDADLFVGKMLPMIQQKQQWLAEHEDKIIKLIEQSQKPAQQIVQSLRQNNSR